MKAAFYECDITPPLGGSMPGYYRPNPAQDVFERLYAKALVVEDEGNYAAIVALDACEYSEELTEIVTKRVYEYTGIPETSVCIHIVHTHKGVPVEDLPYLGVTADHAYRDVYCRLAADAIILAYKRLEEAEPFFGLSRAEGLSFNRNYVLTDGTIRSFGVGNGTLDHMLAGVDPQLPVMVFMRNGTPIGALISFACHQDCTGSEVNGYSGDYSAILSKELKKQYGQDFVSLFLIGTAGDINHIPTDKTVALPPFWYREMGKRLAMHASEAIRSAKPVGNGIRVCKETIRIPRRQADNAAVTRQIQQWAERGDGMMRTRNLLYYHATNQERFSDLILQCIRIGNTCIYVFPGEIYVNFGLRIKERSPFSNNFVIENSNCFGGYIPTPEAFAPESDLYETSLCYDSRHIPEAGDRMVEQLLKMANEL